jgi:hypothetical protein
MAITVSGTTITFNDATTQTTAGGAVNTTTVLAATAGGTASALGTYVFAFCSYTAAGVIGPGTNVAGSTLYYATASGFVTTYTVAVGTWKCMGYDFYPGTFTQVDGVTLWLRIS